MFIRKHTGHFHDTVSNAARTEGNSDTSLYLQVYKLGLSGCYLMLGRLRNSNASQGSVHHPLTSSYFPEDVYKSVLIQISVLITLIYPRPDLEDFMV